MSKSRTITTFLIDWNPTWFRKIYLNNRLTLGFFIPRKDLDKAKNREEFSRSWVYFLIWKDFEDKNLVYIWQATNLFERIKQHNNDINKDYWNSLVIFTTTDASWNESDINYLEKELILEAKNLWNYIIKNSKLWNFWLAKEEQISSLKENIKDIKILISSLWISIFKEKIQAEDKKEKYFCKRNWNYWFWYYTDEGFLVLKWSEWPLDLNPSVIKNKGYAFRNRPLLLKKWIIEERENKIVFIEDYLFSSPTASAELISGSNINGWDFWKTENWKTLHEIERKNKNI